ncbi:MAG: hypothetical protein HYX25_07740 [Candidatus Solibacter usitatus]|nr:hypothetical protein [Candidatus Solibacter usitatus]
MNFNEEEIGTPSSEDRSGVTPGAPDEGAVGQLYRSLARTYAGEIQRHRMRRKRIIAGVVALSVISFAGLMALSYWASV